MTKIEKAKSIEKDQMIKINTINKLRRITISKIDKQRICKKILQVQLEKYLYSVCDII